MLRFFYYLLCSTVIYFGFSTAFAQEQNETSASVEQTPELLTWLQRWQAEIPPSKTEAQLVTANELHAFYSRHQFQPVWQGERLQALTQQIQNLTDDGLYPQNYALNALQEALQTKPANPLAFDLLASSAYLQALCHLHFGVLKTSAAEPLWHADPQPSTSELFAVLLDDAAQHLDELPAVFQRARPQSGFYENLRAQYIHWQKNPPHWSNLASGATLRPNMRHTRVAALRQRLLPVQNPTNTAQAADENLFDLQLVEAVKTFQRHHGLNEDGSVGPATIAALNIPPAARLQQIRLNLERIRFFARYQLQRHPRRLLVNIASAMLRYYNDNEIRWQARVQVGHDSRRTPQIYSNVTRFTLNPTWTVPPNIFKKDKLPQIREDIDYLQRQRMSVLDQDGHLIDPSTIDWQQPGPILLRQAAGKGNALGQVVLRFMNPYSIYLHDTPSQHLFNRDIRTTSSGCVRVKGIMDLIEQLVTDTGTMERDALYRLLEKGKTRQVNLSHPIPILLAYWSAEADPQDGLYFYPDPYHLEADLNSKITRANEQTALHLMRIQALTS